MKVLEENYMPSSVSKIGLKTSWAVMAHTFNPSAWEPETDRSLSLKPAFSTESSRTARATQRNPVSKNQKKKKKKKNVLNED